MRSYLKKGSRIRVPGGIIYSILGEPIGEGGGSIIYPALRSIPDGDGYRTGRIVYAIKECFPTSDLFLTERNADGEIIARSRDITEAGNVSAGEFLNRVKAMQLEEEDISGRVYTHAFRLTPILESYQTVELSPGEGEKFVTVSNMISVMESLSGKGQSLKSLLKEKKSLRAREAFPVIRQVLSAIREVHQEGFLHLDIQDGNVFLKGVLNEGDSAVSILDFGSARPILEDGLCAPVSDGILYSTQGFSAPEILQKNDGQLRLGKEADLYSAGCLLLLLLTGHRYTTTELIANHTGKYIPRFAVRKTQCPKHLVDKMQHIIARALQNEPEERYHSAEEMAVDVDEMIALLAPHKDPLSAMDYDAFICYRHGEKDSAAAVAVRNALERYKSGIFEKSQIKRVFLDEGELSSCADFGDRINQILEKSEWLILICSGRTRESRWVNEEIKAFLRHHDKNHILALLIEGEPEEVYPEELIKSGFTARNLLAADVRAESIDGIVKKIRGDGRLRLAAPILNTTFDALKQRNRIYTMQRSFMVAAIVLCAMAGFSGYAAIKASQIAEQQKEIAQQAETIVAEQDQKIEYQADLLAQQAQKAYDSRDYAEAEKLACESQELSGEDEKRQSDIKRILVNCRNYYVRPDEASELPIPVGQIEDETGTDLLGYFLNSDGSRLFTVSEKAFCVWNTEDDSLISRTEENELWENMYYDWEKNLLEDQNLYVFEADDERSLACYDYETGEISWRRDIGDDGSRIKKVVVSEDGKWIYCIYVIREEDSSGILDILDGYDSFIGISSVHEEGSSEKQTVGIEVLSAADGKVQRSIRYEVDASLTFGTAAGISSDGKYMAIEAYEKTDDANTFALSVSIFNLEDSSMTRQSLGFSDPWKDKSMDSLLFTEDGRLLLSQYDGAADMQESLDDDHHVTMRSPKQYCLYCYDYLKGEIMWQYSKDADADNDLRSSARPYLLRSRNDGEKIVLVTVGNTLISIEEKSGNVLSETQLEARIEHMDDTDKRTRLVLANGEVALIFRNPATEGNLGVVACFEADLTGVTCVHDGCFYVTNESDPSIITKYQLDRYDESYREEEFSGTTPEEFIRSLPEDDRQSENEETKLTLDENSCAFEISNKEDGDSDPIRVETNESIQVLSLTPSGKNILACAGQSILLYDLEGKQISRTELSQSEYDSYIEGREYILYFPE